MPLLLTLCWQASNVVISIQLLRWSASDFAVAVAFRTRGTYWLGVAAEGRKRKRMLTSQHRYKSTGGRSR